MTATFEDVRINGNLTIGGDNPEILRSDLRQDNLALYTIPWTAWRVWDAFHTNLPGTAATDDLGLIGGTLATNAPSLQTQDHKSAGSSQDNYARCMVTLPPEYSAAETVQIRFTCGMKTNLADQAALLDLVVHESDLDDTVSADLVTTSPTTMNIIVPTMTTINFNVTSTTLVPGDILDIRVHTAVDDNNTGTPVIGFIGGAWLLCDIKG